MKKRSLHGVRAIGVFFAAALPAAVFAQGQPDWDYFFSSELRVDDNVTLLDDSPGTGTLLLNTFGIGNRMRTRVSDFAMDLSGVLRVQDLPDDDETTALDDPRLRLGYNRAVGDDAIGLVFSANRVSVAFFDALREDGRTNTLDFDDTRGDGFRESVSARLFGLVNEDGPFSASYEFSGFRLRYLDNDEPDLDDRDELSGRVSLFADLTPRVRAALDTSYDYEREDDDFDTERRRFRVAPGVDLALDALTRLDLRLGYAEVETDREPPGLDDTTTGVIGLVGLTRNLRNGEARLRYSVDVDENGQRDRLTVGRSFERDSISFGIDLGITANELSDNIRPIGTLSYRQDFRRAQFAARLDQDARAEDGRDTVFTRLSLSYLQELTSDVGVNFDLAAGRKFDELDDNQVTNRLTLQASVRTTLTREWDLDVGYRHRYREGQDGDIATSNALFATIVRPLGIN